MSYHPIKDAIRSLHLNESRLWLLTQRLNQIIKSSLLRLGVEIHRRKMYGSDLYLDIKSTLGMQQAINAFDVGANTGQTALAFSRLLPQATIHSFEPNPEAYAVLAKVAAGNRRIFPHRIALGRQSGKSTMYLTRSSLTSSMLPTSGQATGLLGELADPAGQIDVEVLTLDDFLREEDITHLDLLKLDVQGFELEVLKGAEGCFAESRVSLIMTEVNFVDLYERQAFFQDIYAELIKNGFQMVGLYHGDYRSGPFLAWCDALFVNVEALTKRNGPIPATRQRHD